jgi:tRNA pseudouridine32 synthase/23S rRNA pseudouridine746 synthase
MRPSRSYREEGAPAAPKELCYPGSVSELFTPFVPPPSEVELPRIFPSPLDELGPHPLARRAAEVLQRELRAAPDLLGPEGKMVGVLVVQAPSGEIGWLRAFSGMIGGEWSRRGFVPPVFDMAARERLEPAGEAKLRRLTEAFDAVDGELRQLCSVQQDAAGDRSRALEALVQVHRRRRQERASLRAACIDAAQLHALDQQSRADKAERRRLDAAHAEAEADEARASRPLRRRRAALDRLRRLTSRQSMRAIFDTYSLPMAGGGERALRPLFAPGEPPSGAGDCAAPKLLAFAHRHGLTPLALAEFWWGPPPATGGRREGAFYPACSRKCAPLLPVLLEDVAVAPRRSFEAVPAKAAELSVLYEDRVLVALDKPGDLLSVPGKGVTRQDSVLTRLRARYPHARGPLLVHRLDLETSGILLAALTPEVHAAVQRQFLERTVEKRYVALLDGPVELDEGRIRLALRVDLDDRPRQIHDPVHGRDAVTDFRVLARERDQTRVALFPRTGRTHQLRAHAAHPLGLNAPIRGDRLYGHAAERLFLHAEELVLAHPTTGQILRLNSPAPF